MNSSSLRVSRVLAFATLAAFGARAEDPAPTAATSTPERPASAFQAAKAFLTVLDAFDPSKERLALTSLEAERVAPRKKRGESVKIEVWLALTAPSPEQDLVAARELVATVEKDTAFVDAQVFDGYREPGPNGLAPERRVRVKLQWDPAKAPARARREEPSRADHGETYIRMQAVKDRVEVGNLDLELVTRDIPGSNWVDQRWTIRGCDRERGFVRLRIHNFATVLEHDHPHATITRIAVTPPIGRDAVEHPDCLGMDLELSILCPPRPDEVAPPPKPR